jgi:hypothetical protein
MKRVHFALFFLVSVLSFNCQKEFSKAGFGINNTDNNVSAPVVATLQGNIIDETGQPATGVQIKVGAKTTTTDANGYFRIIDAALDKNASLVTAEKPGYFKAYRTFNATPAVNQVVIKLLKKTLAGSVNATNGGDIALSNGAKISLPANSVVSESNGLPYTGSINVYAAYIDPTGADITETIPGSFMANDKNNKRVTLKSFVMMAVVLESTSGEKLQITSGNTAKLTIPIPSSVQSSATASISLWSIDEQTGLWKEEGVATKSGTNYTGDVKHFSFWNCDFSEPAVTISMILKNSSGLPLIYASVLVRADTGGIARGYTDSLGQVNGLVPANENLMLQVLDECGVTVYSQNIGPFSQNTNLGNITVGNSTSSVVTIQGTLIDCNNAPVSNGYALISYSNMVRYAGTNNKGEFSMTFITCSAIQSTVDIFGVDLVSLQQGPTVTISISSTGVNTGNIFACGTLASEYIKFDLDGTQHNLINSGMDSFYVYTYPGPIPLFTTSASGSQFGTYISFEFNHNQAAGTFPMTRLLLSNSAGCVLVQPFNINLTNYPQNIGEFYEGNFSGQFKDSVSLGSLHNINCTFRMKKSQ